MHAHMPICLSHCLPSPFLFCRTLCIAVALAGQPRWLPRLPGPASFTSHYKFWLTGYHDCLRPACLPVIGVVIVVVVVVVVVAVWLVVGCWLPSPALQIQWLPVLPARPGLATLSGARLID